MPPAARIGDMHTCPLATPGTPPIPHVGGPISTGFPTVLIGFMPAARVTDMATCVGPPDSIAMGSPTVLIGNLMAARIGDPTLHGGVVAVGCPTVIIGEVGSGSGLPPRLGASIRKSHGVIDPTESPQSAALKDAAAEGTPLVEKCPYADH
jgi:uncharacterized Zn-binding protein involved in type VI secretion